MFTSIKLKKKLIVCLLFFMLTATAGATGYIEEPNPNDQAGASIKGEDVTEFSDFTIYIQILLWVILLNIISSIDMLLYPTRLIYVITGFRITQQANLLDNSSRHIIHTYIKNNHGAYFSEIVENTGLNRGTVQYHLQILETKNKIEAYEDSGKIRYFLKSSEYSKEEKKVLVTLKNITNQRIISEILNGKFNNATLAREIGISKGTVSWHMKNLKETGLIKETKTGRNVIYKINTSYKTLIKRYK
jgi:predicted transcriptional regulator